MSNPFPNEIDRKVSYSVDINIPPQLHQNPILANLISNYNLVINFNAAVLDRKASGGGWFNLSLEGDLQDIEHALNYLQDLEIEVFLRALEVIGVDPTAPTTTDLEKKQEIPNIDRLVTDYDL